MKPTRALLVFARFGASSFWALRDVCAVWGACCPACSSASIWAFPWSAGSALYDLGYRGHVDFVDGNLIGNKHAPIRFLPELIAWHRARGYPFQVSTEASLNLADDDQLLGLMRDALRSSPASRRPTPRR